MKRAPALVITRVARVVAVLAMAAGLALSARPAHAQLRASGNGFLFGAPFATITLRGGYAQPLASSDLFDFTTSQLSLRRRDLGGVELGADIAWRASDHVEWLLSADVSTRLAGSDYRDWQDNQGRPIEQSTGFTRVPVMAGVRLNLMSPGRAIGRLAWIPSRFTPWVAAHAGVMWYQFEQKGDFINFANGNAVFPGELKSTGWAPAAAASAGFSWNLTPSLALTTQGRYVYARKPLGSDFAGFQPIDLAGVSLTTGITFRLR